MCVVQHVYEVGVKPVDRTKWSLQSPPKGRRWFRALWPFNRRPSVITIELPRP